MANELKHELNISGDTIILNGERPIYRVEIFNSDFSTELKYKSKDVKVPLNDLPIGRYTVMVRLVDKLIAINLLRQKPFDDISGNDVSLNLAAKTRALTELKARENKNSTAASSKSKIVKRSSTTESKYSKTPTKRIVGNKTKPSKNIKKLNDAASRDNSNRASGRKETKSYITSSETRRNVEGYWVVRTSQGYMGKKIIRHFAKTEDLDYLLARIELEHNTRSGKQNTLQIWEVYNLDAFKVEHAKNRNYIKVADSPYFNIEPYFDSKAEVSN